MTVETVPLQVVSALSQLATQRGSTFVSQYSVFPLPRVVDLSCISVIFNLAGEAFRRAIILTPNDQDPLDRNYVGRCDRGG